MVLTGGKVHSRDWLNLFIDGKSEARQTALPDMKGEFELWHPAGKYIADSRA